MADPISVDSGLLASVAFALQSSEVLYQTIASFRSGQKVVLEVREELQILIAVLKTLQEIASNTDVNLAMLQTPLFGYSKACKDIETVILKTTGSSDGSRTILRDWARLRYVGEDIVSFRNLLAGYKSTFTIALADANLRTSGITGKALKEHMDSISNSIVDLEKRLQEIDQKLQAPNSTPSDERVLERQQIQDVRDSNQHENRSHTFEGISVTMGGHHLVVTTPADLFSVKRVTGGNNSRALLGHVSDATLAQLVPLHAKDGASISELSDHSPGDLISVENVVAGERSVSLLGQTSDAPLEHLLSSHAKDEAGIRGLSDQSSTSSVASSVASVFSGRSGSSKSSVIGPAGAGERLVALLLSDNQLSLLYREALKRVTANKFERKFREMLKQFAIELRKEAKDSQQRSVASFVRYRARNSAHLVLNSICSPDEPREVIILPSKVIHEPLNLESDESDEDCGPDHENNTDLQKLEEFIITSQALIQLRQKLTSFVYPVGNERIDVKGERKFVKKPDVKGELEEQNLCEQEPAKTAMIPTQLDRQTTAASTSTRSLLTRSLTGKNSGSDTVGDRKGPLGLHTLFEPAKPALADLIFVHGLGGGSRSTWTKSDDPSLYWPEKWLPNDDGFQDVRIHSFGYDSNWANIEDSTLIEDFAKLLLDSIQLCPLIPWQTTTPLVLVGHSMGGLVIKCALIIAKQTGDFFPLAQRIRTILFLATPHRGAPNAEFRSKLVTLTSGRQLYVKDSYRYSTAMRSINDEFRQYCQDLQIYSFFETMYTSFLATKSFLDTNSSTLGYPGEVVIPLSADHNGVCRYSDTSDPNYQKVRNVLAHAFERVRDKVVLSKRDPDHEQHRALKTFLGGSSTHEDDFIVIDGLRLAGSCEWLMNKKSFQAWRDSSRAQIYWISAKPVTGKTVLSGKIITHLRSLDHDCAFFFFNCRDKSKSNITSFLLSMAWQMSTHNSEALRVVLDTCEKDSQLNKADHRTIWRNLFLEGILTLHFLRPQYWVIDALDECNSDHELFPLLLEALGTGQVRIILTSREKFEPYRPMALFNARVISEEILKKDTNSDIALYLEANIRELPLLDEEARQEMVRTMLDLSAGCFLWVTLLMQELKRVHTPDEIRLVLESVPLDINELYLNTDYTGMCKFYNKEDPTYIIVRNALRSLVDKALFRKGVEPVMPTVQSDKVENTSAISGKHDGSIANDGASSVGSTWVDKSTISGFSRPNKQVRSVDSGYISWTYQPSTGSRKDQVTTHSKNIPIADRSLEDMKGLEEEDARSQKSVRSIGEGNSSIAESLVGKDIPKIAQALIIEVLENDEVLNPLVRESLEKFDRHRVVRNLAKFIHGYCVLLSNARPTLTQKRTLRFFRHRRTQFASILCNNLDPSTLDLNESIAGEKSKTLAAERKARLARWVTDDPGKVSPTPSVAGDDSDISDDESWSSYEGLPPVLEDIKVFLTDGEPLELFRQNFARFVAGESIKDWNSMIESNLQLHREREVDHTKAYAISSSPLSATNSSRSLETKRESIIELENHSGFQVSWGCRCGRRFEARIAGSDRRDAEVFLQRMDWKVERDGPMVTHCFNWQWLENLLWVLAPNLLGRFSFELPSIRTESEDLEARRESNLPQYISNQTNRGHEGAGVQMGRRSTANEVDPIRDLVYVCIFKKKNNNWRLKHAKIYRSSDTQLSETQEREGKEITPNMDTALFRALRERLVGIQKGTGWFSPLVITGLEFWEFKLFYTAKLVKLVKKDKLPYESQATEPESPDPNSTLHLEEWEYNSLTGQRLSDYKELLQSEFLLHLLKFPEDAHPESPVWTGLPRKIRTKLVNRQSIPKIGWGFSVDHEWNALAFTIFMCPIIIAGFVLAIYLAVRDQWPVSAAITLALAPVTLITFLNTMLKDVMKQRALSK